MMVWWMYLYIFAVMAWQYVVPNIAAYNDNLNLLYLIEKLAFLIALLVAWMNSKGGWKILYANLFGASLTYAASSYFANWALGRQAYYSGSLYDIPLTASMAWITVIGLWSRDDAPQPRPTDQFCLAWRLAGARRHGHGFFPALFCRLGFAGFQHPIPHPLFPPGSYSWRCAFHGHHGFRAPAFA